MLHEEENPPTIYGELVLIGCDGHVISNSLETQRNKYILYQRVKPNGVKPLSGGEVISVAKPFVNKSSKQNITFSQKQSAKVCFSFDKETDVFQVGRSANSIIDFSIPKMVNPFKYGPLGRQICQISRYACRIVVSRSGNFPARIYAAGVDSARNIKLGEAAYTWKNDDGEIDHFTTYGTLIMHPDRSISGEIKPGVWREVSVRGSIFPLRDRPSNPQGRTKIDGESNILEDGTLIDLGGVALLWRSAQGLCRSSTKDHWLEKQVELRARKVFYPLVLISETVTEPTIRLSGYRIYLFFECGHILCFGTIQIGLKDQKCFFCRKKGRVSYLRTEGEYAFCVDYEPLTFAFDPCGHAGSEKTVKYWASVRLPYKRVAVCPYCAATLSDNPGYVNLIFQERID